MEILFEKLTQAINSLPDDIADSRRLFHGRGQTHPSLEFLTLDLYDPVLLITFFDCPPENWETAFFKRLKSGLKTSRLKGVILQRRYLKNAPSEVIQGSIPSTLFAKRGSLRFQIKLGSRQNSGYFLDMEPGRAWVQERCAGKAVLNLFAYTCAFSVVALAASAAQVFNVDMSSSALNQGRENHRLNDLPSQGSSYLAGNVFKSWGRIRRRGPYDIVIIDPPSYQPGSFIASKDYARVAKRLPELLKPGGEALLCLNSPEYSVADFQKIIAQASPDAEYVKRLDPSNDFPDTNAERQLKLLIYRLPKPQAL